MYVFYIIIFLIFFFIMTTYSSTKHEHFVNYHKEYINYLNNETKGSRFKPNFVKYFHHLKSDLNKNNPLKPFNMDLDDKSINFSVQKLPLRKYLPTDFKCQRQYMTCTSNHVPRTPFKKDIIYDIPVILR
jgi:hypothetical protein